MVANKVYQANTASDGTDFFNGDFILLTCWLCFYIIN